MPIYRSFFKIAIILFWITFIFSFLSWSSVTFFKSDRKSINICAWIGSFDLKYLARFERETGIKVNVSFYESNEELLLKLGSTGGGYDLIIPSDYAVYYLRKKNMLKKIDKAKLTFYNALNPLLLGHYFDKANDYSIPFEWAVIGLGINKECYEPSEIKNSWRMIFKKKAVKGLKKGIIMTNDPLVALPIASLYLTRDLDFSSSILEAIVQLLKRQRHNVEAYTDFRASYYLESKNCCVAVASSSAVFMSMRAYSHIDFILPDEGSLVTLENFALPIRSMKEDLVYAFMNFMLKPESVAHSFNEKGFFPSTLDALGLIDMHPKVRHLLTLPKKDFSHFHFLRYDQLRTVISDSKLQDVWVKVKNL